MTIKPYTEEERERFEEHYDRIDPDTGYEYDLEPEDKEQE